MKKPQHGGYRANSGRKSVHGKTVVMRIPEGLREIVLKMIAGYRP